MQLDCPRTIDHLSPLAMDRDRLFCSEVHGCYGKGAEGASKAPLEEAPGASSEKSEHAATESYPAHTRVRKVTKGGSASSALIEVAH